VARICTRFSPAVAVIASLALAACGDNAATNASVNGATNMTVSMRAETVGAASGAVVRNGLVSASVASSAAGPVVVGLSNDTLVIESVKLVLDNVRLRKTGVAACLDSIKPAREDRTASDVAGCARLDLGAMVVNVPLTAKDTAPVSAKIPAGSYRGIKFNLRRVRQGPESNARDSAILAANPDLAGASVRIAGKYRDTSFVFYSRASAEIEVEFDPPLVVGADAPDNVTISVRPSSWFVGANGAILMPANELNRRLINERIRTAFRAFGDRRREGRGDEAGRGSKSGTGRETESDTTRARG
jgi:hypothetical protein